MKIGIITFNDTTNYGAALQTFALNKKISNMGYEAETIRYNCENIQRRELPAKFKDVSGLKARVIWALTIVGKCKKYEYIKNFLEENIKLSVTAYNRTDIALSESIYSKFIVGSDIIWETNVTGHDYTYYLDFVTEPSKKISYSASFGYDDIPNDEKSKIREFLSSFKSLAVREEQGQNIIKKLLPLKNVALTCDPTLLLTSEEWEEYILDALDYEKDSYVFVYFDDKEGKILAAAKEYALKHGKKVVFYNASVKKVRGVQNIKNISVGGFLSLIKNSSMVFTGSYHGVCFSVLFEIPFVFLNRAHASRILTLAHVLGFERQNLEIYPDINENIDFKMIKIRLKQFREKSLEYICNSLND